MCDATVAKKKEEKKIKQRKKMFSKALLGGKTFPRNGRHAVEAKKKHHKGASLLLSKIHKNNLFSADVVSSVIRDN